MTIKQKLTATAAAVAVLAGVSAAQAEELTVAYFLEWPTPNQYAQHNKLYEEALGMKKLCGSTHAAHHFLADAIHSTPRCSTQVFKFLFPNGIRCNNNHFNGVNNDDEEALLGNFRTTQTQIEKLDKRGNPFVQLFTYAARSSTLS